MVFLDFTLICCQTKLFFMSDEKFLSALTQNCAKSLTLTLRLISLACCLHLTSLYYSHPLQHFLFRYVTTVIARLFYTASAWNKKLTLPGLRKSEFAQVLNSLDALDDINNEQRFFSYEHFYVIYCRFWELDSDHDLKIGPTDLSKYGDYR